MAGLKSGAKGNDVKALQEKLNASGAKPKLKADGKFGARTEEALKEWQKKNGVKADGVADSKTMAKLGGGKAEPALKWPFKWVPAEFVKIYDVDIADLKKMDKEWRPRLDLWKDKESVKLANEYNRMYNTCMSALENAKREMEKAQDFKIFFDKYKDKEPETAKNVIVPAEKAFNLASRHAETFILHNSFKPILEEAHKLSAQKLE